MHTVSEQELEKVKTWEQDQHLTLALTLTLILTISPNLPTPIATMLGCDRELCIWICLIAEVF